MSNRDKLHFVEFTQAAFDFLENGFGFIRTVVSPLKVWYEARAVYIEICHGDYDFEIAIAFGRLHRVEPERFDFTLFLRLVNPTLEKAMGERIADKESTVCETVHQLAQALHSEGIEIIRGRDTVFERMSNVAWWHFRPDALKHVQPTLTPQARVTLSSAASVHRCLQATPACR